MRLWLIFIACGMVTFATRSSFIALGDRVSVPPVMERALRYVAPAAFAALAVPLALGGDGFEEFGDDIPRLLAATAAGAFIVWRKTIPGSLVVGMGTLWLLQWLGL